MRRRPLACLRLMSAEPWGEIGERGVVAQAAGGSGFVSPAAAARPDPGRSSLSGCRAGVGYYGL